MLGRRDLTHEEKGVSFAYSHLSHTDLSGFELAYCLYDHFYFVGSTLHKVMAYSGHLDQARLREARLDEAFFLKASLRGADLRDSTARCAQFSIADLSGAQVEADMTGAHLSSAVLYGANFVDSGLAYASLGGADVNAADFVRVDLRYADLRDLKNWRSIRGLKGSNLYGAITPPGFLRWARTRGAVSFETDEEWTRYDREVRIYPHLERPCSFTEPQEHPFPPESVR